MKDKKPFGILSMVLLLLIAIFAVASWFYVSDPQKFPIENVEIHGISPNIDKEAMQQVMLSEIQKGFFRVNVNALQQKLISFPWIKEVAIRRVWPAKLIVSVEEHKAIAKWGDKGLLSDEGKLFFPATSTISFNLPQLEGPAGKEQYVLQNYLKMQQQLDFLGVKAAKVVLESRGSWSLELDQGLKVELGRDDFHKRLVKFVQAYPDVARLTGKTAIYVDMRYPNGMAVKWQSGG